ncbi:MAG: hypothetical protein KIT14_13045 [bacterium]|nr:hypothetical protein [bacterium]
MSGRRAAALRVAIGVAALAYVAHVTTLAGGGDLWRYPYVHADSWDWLANGLRWSGVPVHSTWRAPLNPLVYAALWSHGLEHAIPWLAPLGFAAILVGLLTIGWAALGPAAAAGALLVASNHLLLAHALTIGSDVLSAGLGLLGLLALCVAMERRAAGWLYVASAGLVLGFLTQPSTPFLAPACAAVVLYDARARRWVGLDGVRWLLRRRHAWGALALGVGLLAAVACLRRLLIGTWTTPSSIGRPVVFGLDHAAFYGWCTLGALGIPAAVLAGFGVVSGLRHAERRRATLALVGAVAGMVALFGFAYDWRDNRFVVYWAAPGLLLAGLGVTRLPLAAALPALAAAVVWGNLTARAAGGPPGHAAAIVLAPHRVWEIAYHATGTTTAVVATDRPAYPFARRVRRWVRRQQRRFANPARDGIVFAERRYAVAAGAARHLGPNQTLFLHVGPDEDPTYVYVLQNQMALWSGHPAQATRLGVPAAAAVLADPTAIVVLRRAELDRLRAEHIVAPDVTVLDDGAAWMLIGLGPGRGAQGRARNSRTMSSSERVIPQPG